MEMTVYQLEHKEEIQVIFHKSMDLLISSILDNIALIKSQESQLLKSYFSFSIKHKTKLITKFNRVQ